MTSSAAEPRSWEALDVPAEVLDRFKGARRVLTVCHENPESDALGSALAFALAAEELGARATPVCADPVPEMYDFLPQMDRFGQQPEPGVEYDLIIVSDCGELERIGRILPENAELFGRVPILNIDHHKSNAGFGAVDWIDPAAAATCEMGTYLVQALGVPLSAADGAVAASLMAGIVIDTGNFQHSNTTQRTLRAAADLVEAGAPLSETARRLYRTKPNAQLKLFGLVLARLETALEGRLVWSSLLVDDLAAADAPPSYSEGLVDLLSQSASGDVVVLFKEVGAETRISVRTRDGGVDATVLTGHFGGGGHARASGATVAAPLAEAQRLVRAEAERLIAQLPRPAE
ncbi:MAG: bifunctional oligoribonuclease/PAP phosphatase NrnA [Chloroflexi bacterium]|nr:bifunctional oligoribonuclease/PAP phosphatase NrnA [Chloroflexota bacterium]HEV8053327.1 bifunctional oligoribonuclease/PAP phosphatase NrnA [Candidatus Limnocylindrales bacterium]